MTQKWEYQKRRWGFGDGSIGDVSDGWNAIGEQGWELVGMVEDGEDPDDTIGYFKRPLPE